MTDEEMAEKEYENCKFEKIEHYCDKAIYVTGFLAGLKAGRPQWHKVADGDLPKEDCKVYLAIAKGDTEPSLYDYIASEEGQWEWLPRRIAVLSNEQIEKWCEIPTFDKE